MSEYYKKSSVVALASSAVSSVIAAFANAATITTEMEADGWTFERDGTVGVSMTPPGSPNHRIVIAGVDSGSPTPPMLSPDTFLATALLSQNVHNVTTGTFDWDASAAGYTGSAVGSGNMRCFDSDASAIDRIQVMYNDHACWIKVWIAGTNNSTKWAILGGLVKPTNPADAEDDGFQWGMSCNGTVSTSGTSATWWAGATAGNATGNHIFAHAATNGNAHTFFRVGGTYTGCTKTWTGTVGEGQFFRDTGGSLHYQPHPIILTTGSSGGSIGQVHNAFIGHDVLDQQIYQAKVSTVSTNLYFHMSNAVNSGTADSVAFLMFDPATID